MSEFNYEDLLNEPSSSARANGVKTNSGITGNTLVINSTQGKISLSADATVILGVQNGDYLLFVDNNETLSKEVNNKGKLFQAWSKEEGLSINDPLTAAAFKNQWRAYFIAKGYARVDDKGEPVLGKAKLTDEDVKAYLDEHREEIYLSNPDGIRQAVEKSYEAEGWELPTDENELVELCKSAITIDLIDRKQIPVDEVQQYAGAKLASIGGRGGVGIQLSCSDMGNWNELKRDIPEEDRKKKNRRYVILDNKAKQQTMRNGAKDEVVMCYPIKFVEDEDPKEVPFKNANTKGGTAED
jgi:hypothetical protein